MNSRGRISNNQGEQPEPRSQNGKQKFRKHLELNQNQESIY